MNLFDDYSEYRPTGRRLSNDTRSTFKQILECGNPVEKLTPNVIASISRSRVQGTIRIVSCNNAYERGVTSIELEPV